MIRPVRLTWSPSLISVSGPMMITADVVLFQVQDHTHNAVGELDQLAGHRVLKPVDARDTVADLQHGTHADFGYFFLVGRSCVSRTWATSSGLMLTAIVLLRSSHCVA